MSSQTSGIDPVGIASPADHDRALSEETQTLMIPEAMGGKDAEPEAKPRGVVRPGDRIFSGLATGSGIFVVALIGLVAVFLILRAVPALSNDEENFFLYNGPWRTDDTAHMHFGVLDLFSVTVFVSIFALLLAMPVALGIAIYLTEYAPARVRGPLAYVIDLLAAVPSIVYGLWGIYVLAPAIAPIALWLNRNLGFIPLFADSPVNIGGGGNLFTGGIVLAVMILPIIAAVTREVFIQTPKGQIEAALALGATKWEVVRTTIIPFGTSGYVSGSMLGLGRALGETIALMLILSGTSVAFGWSLFDSGSTFATHIASNASEFNNELEAGAYIAAGLVLFVLTFLVNSAARAVVGGKGRA
ncbi:phosphate ABC transporter permease subunit PstC [Mycobacteroides saopaulense]|uniref:Phosphate transport system permease protein n=1 Tax=Mycobacteroides saopaulense TaxID=1578165 RepID=A0ABX3BZF0_9MYCO|nr:phosphate ABC transporter permease subunit PstC [Mycobacteroides saopaulense]OHT81591.1 phosphate ABC transporter permease subunit PstC [Mycobacteroides saopaulense]OHU09119.1 phosphate ABC transporter permease subunit PstC [Mycobacteroides saopaulense]